MELYFLSKTSGGEFHNVFRFNKYSPSAARIERFGQLTRRYFDDIGVVWALSPIVLEQRRGWMSFRCVLIDQDFPAFLDSVTIGTCKTL